MSDLHRTPLIDLLASCGSIIVLGAILFPVFARAREKALQTTCLVELKQVGKALKIYAEENDGALPTDPQKLAWMKSLPRGVPIETGLISCPAYNPHSITSLGSGLGFNLSHSSIPARAATTACLWDGWDLTIKPASADQRAPSWVDWRHDGGANIGYFDGHAKWYHKPTVDDPVTLPPLPF